MSEQTVDKQTPPPGGSASTPAAGTPSQGTPTAEQVQAYLDTNPDAMKNLRLTAKFDGEERPVALDELRSGYQIRSVAQQRLEAAALKEKELATREAELAAKGDPRKQFEGWISSLAKPPAPDSPLDGMDTPDAIFTEAPRLVAVTRTLYGENQRLSADLQATQQAQAELKKTVAEMQQSQASASQWMHTKEEFDTLRAQVPEFTARVVVKPGGVFDLDLGENRTVMTEVMYLKQTGELPDARFGGRVPKTLSYAELTKGLEAAEAAKYEARKVQAERKHQESVRASASTISQSTSGIEIPSDLIDLPGDSKAEILRKAEARGNLIREQARAMGHIK